MTDSRPTGIADNGVYITRAFAAPRELVWRFFLEPTHLARWFAPTGYSAPAERIIVEPWVGGHWDLTMVQDATGTGYPMRGTILELDEPELLVLELEADSDFGALESMFLRIRFHDHGDRTRVTLHQGPFDPEAQHATEAGWLESFEKLDRSLAS
ncbi:SRPBCC family protein [Leifsonia poae]|uniref:SRPBCC family protein n=1 Tax=Leifsonia poae TaxID=110933 RepID=UPI001CBCD486|nr:SRPBCC domain-containing protein [Leifsonia poae]